MYIWVVARLPQCFLEFFSSPYWPLQNRSARKISKNIDFSLWGEQCIVLTKWTFFHVLAHCVYGAKFVSYFMLQSLRVYLASRATLLPLGESLTIFSVTNFVPTNLLNEFQSSIINVKCFLLLFIEFHFKPISN